MQEVRTLAGYMHMRLGGSDDLAKVLTMKDLQIAGQKIVMLQVRERWQAAQIFRWVTTELRIDQESKVLDSQGSSGTGSGSGIGTGEGRMERQATVEEKRTPSARDSSGGSQGHSICPIQQSNGRWQRFTAGRQVQVWTQRQELLDMQQSRTPSQPQLAVMPLGQRSIHAEEWQRRTASSVAGGGWQAGHHLNAETPIGEPSLGEWDPNEAGGTPTMLGDDYRSKQAEEVGAEPSCRDIDGREEGDPGANRHGGGSQSGTAGSVWRGKLQAGGERVEAYHCERWGAQWWEEDNHVETPPVRDQSIDRQADTLCAGRAVL